MNSLADSGLLRPRRPVARDDERGQALDGGELARGKEPRCVGGVLHLQEDVLPVPSGVAAGEAPPDEPRMAAGRGRHCQDAEHLAPLDSLTSHGASPSVRWPRVVRRVPRMAAEGTSAGARSPVLQGQAAALTMPPSPLMGVVSWCACGCRSRRTSTLFGGEKDLDASPSPGHRCRPRFRDRAIWDTRRARTPLRSRKPRAARPPWRAVTSPFGGRQRMADGAALSIPGTLLRHLRGPA